jgi:protein TonB
MPYHIRASLTIALVVAALSCRSGGSSQMARDTASDTLDQVPVALNAGSPVRYPLSQMTHPVEGRVMLRLVIDSAGGVIADSVTVAESSGFPALDSAALSAAPALRYAPALKRGHPVTVAFLQPVYFHPPDSTAASSDVRE